MSVVLRKFMEKLSFSSSTVNVTWFGLKLLSVFKATSTVSLGIAAIVSSTKTLMNEISGHFVRSESMTSSIKILARAGERQLPIGRPSICLYVPFKA